jgi:hypothetical protein
MNFSVMHFMHENFLKMQEAVWRSQYVREEIKANHNLLDYEKHKESYKFYLQYLREVVVNADIYLDSLEDQRTKEAMVAIDTIQNHLYIINQVLNQI